MGHISVVKITGMGLCAPCIICRLTELVCHIPGELLEAQWPDISDTCRRLYIALLVF